ncbi:MAG: hypothetical protein A3F69_04135 [Acidobacteria bacterium RIFCSPLOWO2_12_FULL_66_10]|nr:MAG: hypothetical protein A3F69_04135 [Acidobacteria bacterium RIFCSPLOWO2_12_FULL_66_10]
MKKAPAPPQTSRRWVLLLVALSFGSGCAALLYQIVWFQLLEFVIGSSAVSLAVLLGTFMAGLCLGSLLLPRIVSTARHPLRVYALLEFGIGASGVAVLAGMPLVSRLYSTTVGHGIPGILLRGLVATICLLPPTVLMGATLPAMGRWLRANARGASQLGVLYSANTIGAVAGCLLAGFYLLRIYDLATVTYVAAALNSALALISIGAAASVAHDRPDVEEPPVASPQQTVGAWTVYVAIGLSGLSALGAEVVWTRLLSLLLGPTVYSFSIILACLLTGLGIGSAGGAVLARRTQNPRRALGWCQLLLTGAVAFAAYMLFEFFPQQLYRPPGNLATEFRSDVTLSLMTMLPAACLWGASFPLALAAAASHERDPGRLVGGIYAANTVGAVIGATATSLLLLAWLGTQNVQRLLIAASALAGVLMLAPWFQPPQPRRSPGGKRQKDMPARWRAAPTIAALAVAGLLAVRIDPVPGLLVAFGPYAGNAIGRSNVLYTGEGMNTSVAVTEGDGVRSFHVSGKVEASNAPPDMQHLRMLAHIPALTHGGPRSVLVVGCGAGVTAGSFIPYSSVERMVIVEIEPLVPRLASQFFSRENNDVVRDPRVTVVNDDGRHYVLTTPETFDIITSDPIHPWVKGSASLYTKEYFELVRRHLKPGGIVSQWVPLYESSQDVVKSEVATFFDVFPGGTIWGTKGGDIVLVGQADPSPINVDAIEERMKRSEAVAALLREVGFSSAIDLLATYSGRASEVGPWLAGAEINRDLSLRLQYRAGLHLDFDNPEAIYASMISGRTYPDDLFVASEGLKQALKRALTARPE